MNKITSLDTDLRLKAAVGLEQAVAQDMDAEDRPLLELLANKIADLEEETDEDTEDTDSSV